MSLSGQNIITGVEFKVDTNNEDYLVDRVQVFKRAVGKIRTMADKSNYVKIDGYHLLIRVQAQDIEQTSAGTFVDAKQLQLDIEDETTDVFFYPDKDQSKNFQVVAASFDDQLWLETEYDARVDPDEIVCVTKNLATKADMEWFIK